MVKWHPAGKWGGSKAAKGAAPKEGHWPPTQGIQEHLPALDVQRTEHLRQWLAPGGRVGNGPGSEGGCG